MCVVSITVRLADCIYEFQRDILCYRTINALLNSSTGGTIYLGVSDNSMVRGLLLSQYKVLSFHWHVKCDYEK